jgi:hypothetical protein
MCFDGKMRHTGDGFENNHRREQAPAGRAPATKTAAPKTGPNVRQNRDGDTIQQQKIALGKNGEEPTPNQEKIGDKGEVVAVTQVQCDQED